jgi:hypothetical protein
MHDRLLRAGKTLKPITSGKLASFENTGIAVNSDKVRAMARQRLNVGSEAAWIE